ncbi:DNA (cytosine-5-)-methyltransferase [Macrococcoides canis]|uniref:DNA (cytosine-5-)-methyltransferase n=1 Tax=Macrococcoides canis TaxID=1855823 RepID=UPI0020B70591|nr:DNA (cytosine-5-)-methyltransferase [Macrococcus canis]UTH01832.1 DNA (cytosine-5-)-methyltransferase [Macrococcus canis]
MENILDDIWEHLKEENDKIQKSFSTDFKKSKGIYFTGLDLTDAIIQDIFKEVKNKDDLLKSKILEPCVGIGNYVYSFIKYVYLNFNLKKDEVILLLNNLYVCDAEINFIKKFISNLNEMILSLYNIQKNEYKINIGYSLVYDVIDENYKYCDIKEYFGDIKFDIIMTNPPYKHLRAESKHYSDSNRYEFDKLLYKNIKQDAKQRFILSNDGSSNLYKFFIEEIILNYSKKNAIISFLVPSNILSDKSNAKIRKEIVLNNSNINIFLVNENDNNIKAKQSMVNITMVKNKTKQTIFFNDFYTKKIISKVDIDIIAELSTDFKIKPLSHEEIKLINALKKFPKISELEFIINRRGELDLTTEKKYISEEKTIYPLIKGRNISKYNVNKSTLYVNKSFIEKGNKQTVVNYERIIGQQISNVNKLERLNFALIPKGFILGNSCNYLYVNHNKYGMNNLYLLAILNSRIINKYFKIISSNNHINNYEIDELPIPIPKEGSLDKICSSVLELLNEFNEEKYDELEKQIQSLYFEEKNIKVSINEKYENKLKLAQSKVDMLKQEDIKFNLSNLDMEIIKSVPQGGNWKNIPQKTIDKSKRLLGIQRTGGRTTLYGRLKIDEPSYTITTYFNRPGNGCNIHPIEDRVLNLREGARLQGFPDNYAFFGSQKDRLNQIGNAIPPFIGYLIGQKINKHLDIKNSLDLFSGAGGLLTGLKQSGINSKVANEIDESAAVTLKINYPNVNVICGDITDKNVKKYIIESSNNIDMVCGGPPCQGFSLAGYRREDDPRNKLFVDFIDIVLNIKPKIIIFENVTGILSSNKGKTYNEIKELFESIDYNIEGRVLSFDNYGIPQKRKRLILIGVRKDINILPSMFFPDMLTYDAEEKITVGDAFSDKLYDFKSDYLKYLQGKIDADTYYRLLNKNIFKQLELF